MAQRTLLEIAKALATEINLRQPLEVASAEDGTSATKLLALIRAICDELVKEYDWEILTKRFELTTVDDQSEYDFPTDIDRWISGTFYDSTRQWELSGPLTARQWEYLLNRQLSASPTLRYRIFGGKIQFDPTPDAGLALVYEYMSSNYALSSGLDVEKNQVTADSDIILLDHRLVIYGAKLKYLESIGRDTTAALADYNRVLAFCTGGDTPAQVIDARGSCSSRLTSPAQHIPDLLVL